MALSCLQCIGKSLKMRLFSRAKACKMVWYFASCWYPRNETTIVSTANLDFKNFPKTTLSQNGIYVMKLFSWTTFPADYPVLFRTGQLIIIVPIVSQWFRIVSQWLHSAFGGFSQYFCVSQWFLIVFWLLPSATQYSQTFLSVLE